MIAQEVAKLPTLTLTELQLMWEKYFDSPATSMNKEFYISRIAYRIQELKYGGLPTATKQLLIDINETQKKIKKANSLPPVGTRLVKEYKGKEYIVTILKDGFDFNGMHYKTLSTIAGLITGQKVSGKFFFKLSNLGG